MRKRNMTLFLLSLSLILLASTSITGLQSQRLDDPPNKDRQAIDDSEWPVTDSEVAEPQDAAKRAKRRAKGKKYDGSLLRVDPTGRVGAVALGDGVDTSLLAFPAAQSSVILLGEITAAQAYLSNDKTGVYTEFTIRVEGLLKNLAAESLVAGATVEAERQGGRVRHPSGHIQRYSVDRQRMPRVGRRYVLFLKGSDEQGFLLLTGYELRDGKVFPLDDLPHTRSYANAEETPFLNELRASLVGSAQASSR